MLLCYFKFKRIQFNKTI